MCRVLFESTTTDAGPCLYARKPVSGVQIHEPLLRVGSYLHNGGSCVVWRLVPEKKLSCDKRQTLRNFAMEYLKRGVSYNTAGAMISATKWSAFGWIPSNRYAVFCSQLIHQALETIGVVAPENSSKYNPARLIRKLRYEESYRKLGTITRDNWQEIASRGFGR